MEERGLLPRISCCLLHFSFFLYSSLTVPLPTGNPERLAQPLARSASPSPSSLLPLDPSAHTHSPVCSHMREEGEGEIQTGQV